MKRFFVTLLKQQGFTFLLLILLASGLVTYLFPASLKPAQQAQLGYHLRCDMAKASKRLQQAPLSQAGRLHLLVSFQQQPTSEQIASYAANGITLYPDSWLFDYLVAETSYDKLCSILTDQAVTYVDLVTS